MPGAGAAGAAAGRARSSRGRRRTPTSPGRAQPRALRRDGARRRPRGTRRAGSTTRSTRVGLGRRRRAAGPRLLPRHAAAARAGRRAAAPARGCWSSTSRPTASTRRASTRSASCCSSSTRPAPRSSSPATCSPRSSRCAPGSACSTAAGWCSRTSSPTCSAHRPGRGAHPRRRAGAGDCWTASSRSTTPSGCWCAPPTRPRSTRRLVAAGVRVTELAAERRTLEEIVLAATGGRAATGSGSDRSWAAR